MGCDLRHCKVQEYGNILDVYLPKDRESGRRRGFGFVEFDSKDDAENAMEQLQGIELDGRSIQIIVAQKGREVKPSNKQAQPDHNGGGRDERKRREKPEESRRRRSRSKSRESDRDADKERSGEKRKHSRRSRSRSKSRRRRKRSRSASEEYK